MKQVLYPIFLLFSTALFAQQPGAFYAVKTNISVGADYQSLRFNGNSVFYSPGGGIGAEFEYGYYLTNRFGLGIKGGYQQMISYHYINQVGVFSTKTSAFFNRKTLAPFGEFLIFNKPGEWFNALRINGGYSLNFSGTLRRIENDTRLQDFEYDDPAGLFLNLTASVNLGKLLSTDAKLLNSNLLFGLGWHKMEYRKTNTESTGQDLERLNGTGIELILGFRKRIGRHSK